MGVTEGVNELTGEGDGEAVTGEGEGDGEAVTGEGEGDGEAVTGEGDGVSICGTELDIIDICSTLTLNGSVDVSGYNSMLITYKLPAASFCIKERIPNVPIVRIPLEFICTTVFPFSVFDIGSTVVYKFPIESNAMLECMLMFDDFVIVPIKPFVSSRNTPVPVFSLDVK